jgi:Asp/Glu/hydantoin racemase
VKILVVNVNTTVSMTDAIAASARSVASPDTEIIGLTPAFGAESVEGNFESYLAADGVTAAVKLAEPLVELGLTNSKTRTFAAPRHKRISGWPLSPGADR